MRLFQRVRYTDVHWSPLLLALILTGTGLAFVFSATYEPAEGGWSPESARQVLWWSISLVACFTVLHVPATTWRESAVPLYFACLLVQLFLLVAAGTPLVPHIKGQANWIVLGPLRLQPSEFTKLGVLLAVARLLTLPQADARQLPWVLAAGAMGLVPVFLIAKEDLGSALTFLPMLFGVLVLAGASLRLLGGAAVAAIAAITLGVLNLPREGPKAYMWKRIAAWLDPESYALTEGFQSLRALRSIGSGRLTGKGFGVGDQNLLGWLPEKHTDMVFAVVGEETGFVGTVLVVVLFLAFGWACLFSAVQARAPFARLVIGGFGCLVVGQAAINLAVVLGLMPVTGITLPFFSYGGSSLLGLHLGLGIALACSVAKTRYFARDSGQF